MSQQRCPKNRRNKARFIELCELNGKIYTLQREISSLKYKSLRTVMDSINDMEEQMNQLEITFNTFQYNLTTDWFQFDRQEQLQQQQTQEQVQQETQVQQQPQEQTEEPIMDEKHFILMSQEDNGEVKYEVCTESSTSEYTSQYTSEYTEEEET